MHDAPEPTWRDPGPDIEGPRFHGASPRLHDARRIPYHAPAREPRSGSRTAVLATLALLLAMLSLGLTVFLNYSPDLGERLLAILKREAPPTLTAAAPVPSSTPPLSTTPSPSTSLPRSTTTSPSATPSTSTAPPLATQAIENRTIAPPAPPSPPADDAKPEESPTVASAPDPLPSKPLAKAATPPPQTETLPRPKHTETAAVTARPPQEAPKAAKPIANAPPPEPIGTAKLTIAVAPQGEIYIDGKHKGTTPPITTLDLEPGLHRIEIRHGSRRPYLTYISVQPGDQRRIRYDFNARSHPPA
jgi:hypothetical protein